MMDAVLGTALLHGLDGFSLLPAEEARIDGIQSRAMRNTLRVLAPWVEEPNREKMLAQGWRQGSIIQVL